MDTSRLCLVLSLCGLLVPARAGSQTSADTGAVWSVAIAKFAHARTIFLDTRQAVPYDLYRSGPPQGRAWLISLERDANVAGLCDSANCTRTLPDEYDMVQLSLPKFVAADTAELFVVHTDQWLEAKNPKCTKADRSSYQLTLVRENKRWFIAKTRPRDQAYLAGSNCFHRPAGSLGSEGRRPPNQRMKLTWRCGRLKGKGSVLMAAAAPRSLCAIR